MTIEKTDLKATYADLVSGLNQTPKRIPSKYFYDAAGDKLFQAIMKLPEYYLTRCEFEILTQQGDSIAQSIKNQQNTFLNVVELGAGDGSKTIHLLKAIQRQMAQLSYYPIDISGDVLIQLKGNLIEQLGDLQIHPIQASYFEALARLNELQPKLILFLGSNLGNFGKVDAQNFIAKLANCMHQGDMLYLGVDIKKNPIEILKAYNDSQGITKRFNLNLLQRLNNDLHANIDVSNFDHYPTYDPISGEARSYLVSLRPQRLSFPVLDFEINLQSGEIIHTEISKKYDQKELNDMVEKAGLSFVDSWQDCKHYFTGNLYKKP